MDDNHAQKPAQRVGWIYIFACGPYLKVGFSVNVPRRLGAVQGACPYDVKLIYKAPVSDADLMLRIAEKFIHKRLARWAHRAEWFKVKPSLAKSVVESVIATVEREVAKQAEDAYYDQLWEPPRRERPWICRSNADRGIVRS